jgi:hypothetical protein
MALQQDGIEGDPNYRCDHSSPTTKQSSKQQGKQRRDDCDVKSANIKPKWMLFSS